MFIMFISCTPNTFLFISCNIQCCHYFICFTCHGVNDRTDVSVSENDCFNYHQIFITRQSYIYELFHGYSFSTFFETHRWNYINAIERLRNAMLLTATQGITGSMGASDAEVRNFVLLFVLFFFFCVVFF